MTGLWVVLAAVLLAGGFGGYRKLTDGRLRAVSNESHLDAHVLGSPLGTSATFVQFSSPVCAPCASTRRVLGAVTTAADGVVHVELDATEHPSLVDRFEIRRTPTVLVLDRHGTVRHTLVGAVREQEARLALANL